jgi:hypothetical protein
VKSIKDSDLPLNSSSLWTQHITPSRPPGGALQQQQQQQQQLNLSQQCQQLSALGFPAAAVSGVFALQHNTAQQLQQPGTL